MSSAGLPIKNKEEKKQHFCVSIVAKEPEEWEDDWWQSERGPKQVGLYIERAYHFHGCLAINASSHFCTRTQHSREARTIPAQRLWAALQERVAASNPLLYHFSVGAVPTWQRTNTVSAFQSHLQLPSLISSGQWVTGPIREAFGCHSTAVFSRNKAMSFIQPIQNYSHTWAQDYYSCKVVSRESTLTLETAGSFSQISKSQLLRLKWHPVGKIQENQLTVRANAAVSQEEYNKVPSAVSWNTHLQEAVFSGPFHLPSWLCVLPSLTS